MGDANLDQLQERSMKNTDAEKKPAAKPQPKPKRVNLTNKAGAGATPLAKDVDAWLATGWTRVE
jgi:hypothetical protein